MKDYLRTQKKTFEKLKLSKKKENNFKVKLEIADR